MSSLQSLLQSSKKVPHPHQVALLWSDQRKENGVAEREGDEEAAAERGASDREDESERSERFKRSGPEVQL